MIDARIILRWGILLHDRGVYDGVVKAEAIRFFQAAVRLALKFAMYVYKRKDAAPLILGLRIKGLCVEELKGAESLLTIDYK
jgi:hypothetical protein